MRILRHRLIITTTALAIVAGIMGGGRIGQRPSRAQQGSVPAVASFVGDLQQQPGTDAPRSPLGPEANRSGEPPQSSADAVGHLTAQIVDAFDSLSIERLNFALTQLLPALVRADPPAAARLAESLTEPNLRAEVMYLVARQWGQFAADEALAWAGGLKVEYEREAALVDAGSDLARENPARALELSARSFRTDQPSAVLENLVQRLAEDRFPAALAWILEHSAGAQREELLARLAWVEARRDPPAAAQRVVDHMRPGDTQDEAVISVLHQWARHDASAALAWVERFPASSLRERAIAELNAIVRSRLASAH